MKAKFFIYILKLKIPHVVDAVLVSFSDVWKQKVIYLIIIFQARKQPKRTKPGKKCEMKLSVNEIKTDSCKSNYIPVTYL